MSIKQIKYELTPIKRDLVSLRNKLTIKSAEISPRIRREMSLYKYYRFNVSDNARNYFDGLLCNAIRVFNKNKDSTDNICASIQCLSAIMKKREFHHINDPEMSNINSAASMLNLYFCHIINYSSRPNIALPLLAKMISYIEDDSQLFSFLQRKPRISSPRISDLLFMSTNRYAERRENFEQKLVELINCDSKNEFISGIGAIVSNIERQPNSFWNIPVKSRELLASKYHPYFPYEPNNELKCQMLVRSIVDRDLESLNDICFMKKDGKEEYGFDASAVGLGYFNTWHDSYVIEELVVPTQYIVNKKLFDSLSVFSNAGVERFCVGKLNNMYILIAEESQSYSGWGTYIPIDSNTLKHFLCGGRSYRDGTYRDGRFPNSNFDEECNELFRMGPVCIFINGAVYLEGGGAFFYTKSFLEKIKRQEKKYNLTAFYHTHFHGKDVKNLLPSAGDIDEDNAQGMIFEDIRIVKDRKNNTHKVFYIPDIISH